MNFIPNPGIIAILILAFFAKLQAAEPGPYLLQEGDIVFSSSAFGQGAAIIAATTSPYTHCGIVKQRYGDINRLPLDEKVVAPSDLAASQMLVEVPRKTSRPE